MDFDNQMQERSSIFRGPMMTEARKMVDAEQCRKWSEILDKYRSAKMPTQRRIIASENWWKMRNAQEAQKETEVGKDGGFVSKSAWLHNVISNKHADAVEAYPEPNILPREEGDMQEAKMLSSIIPCILEQNGFEDTYDSVQWTKCKSGTGVYKVFWDRTMHNGLGDIRVEEINPLNVYWQPGVNRIQKSRYFFQVEMQDRDLLEESYPQLVGKEAETDVQLNYQLDEKEDKVGRLLVVEVYYHKRGVLHYAKYVGETVLYATEDDDNPSGQDGVPMREAGLYDHGLFPFVVDALFPIAGSPFGYGYVDIDKNPQIRIDLMDTAFTKNVMVNAIPRFLCQDEGNIKEEELLDLSKPIIHVAGRVDEASLRQVPQGYLQGASFNLLERATHELRETSGNTETSTGSTPSGVTAASAIAALQEASGKGSKDATRGSYRAYRDVVSLVIELIRQFYSIPRKFRIMGEAGAWEYVQYSNAGMMEQQVGFNGEDMGLRMAVFDIKVTAQKANVYTKISQNELALQMYQMGFFSIQRAPEALEAVKMMEFEGKAQLLQRISANAAILMAMPPVDPAAMTGGKAPKLNATPDGTPKKEHSRVSNARERSANASQPTGGRVI